MNALRILCIWLLTAVLMIVNGIVREAVLVRLAERPLVDVLSAIMGVAIVTGVPRLLLRAPAVPASTAQLLSISAAWLILTLAFEFLFGHYVDRKSWAALLENYAIWRGRLWLIVLIAFVISPFLWLRWTRRTTAAALN